jgi:hypothetical protein
MRAAPPSPNLHTTLAGPLRGLPDAGIPPPAHRRAPAGMIQQIRKNMEKKWNSMHR